MSNLQNLVNGTLTELVALLFSKLSKMMQWKTFVQVLLGRVLIPLSLLAASVLRQNLISLIYFILLLISPLIPRNKLQFSGAFYGYIVVLLAYSSLVLIAQAIFHLYLGLYAAIHHEHYGDVLGANTNSCELTNTLQWIGFQRVDAPSSEAYQSVRLLLPDAVIVLVSVITFKVLQKLDTLLSLPLNQTTNLERSGRSGVIKKYIETFGELTIIILLGVCGAMVPSVISAFYFVIFFGVLLTWSMHIKFKPAPYGMLKMAVFAYLIFHMLLIYLCQLNFLQTWLDRPENSFFTRLLGMTPLLMSGCSEPWKLSLEKHSWPYFANPIALLCTFIVLSLDYAYHRSKNTEIIGNSGNNFSRNSSLRSSENQLLTNEQQPNYDSVGTSAPLAADRDPADTNNDQNDVTNGPTGAQRVRKVWVSIYNFVLRNSYLLAFFAMLLWAVIYPSWTAFVFLILGCLLWLFPNSRRASLICSPILVFYSVCLTGLQYVCSINFGGIDYNTTLFFNVSDNYLISSIGLTGNDYPAVAIMMKMLFTMCFCVVLRELRRENCLRSEGGEDGLCLSPMTRAESLEGIPRMNRSQSVDNANLEMIGGRIMEWFSKYWIVAFYFLLLLMAIQEPYIYRLIYMILFLFSAITFQLHYRFWRYTLTAFLVIVAFYSILAILVVYILSFHEVLINFQEATGLQDKWLADLGFDPNINYQAQEGGNVKLLFRLLVPALLLITVMLQLHIFHKRFMEVTHPDHLTSIMQESGEIERQPSQDSSYGGFVGDIVKLYHHLRPRAQTIFYSICRLVTIHLYKGIYIAAAWIITREASALSFVLLIIINLSLFFDPVGKLRKICLLTAQFWVGLIILAKMLFQLQTVPKEVLMNNCTNMVNHTEVLVNDSNFKGVQDDFAWLGLHTLPEGTGEYVNSLPYYIGGDVLVLGALTVLALFKIHDFHLYKSNKLPAGVTFPTIEKKNLDTGFSKFIGYLINYGFIKFGLEICMVVSVIVVFYRQDAVGSVYILILGILLLLNMYRRRYVRHVWFIYLVFLALILPAQYVSALGLPKTLCRDYPWTESMLKYTLRLWLYLPDYQNPPNVALLMADCIQFLVVSLQWQVFKMEGARDHPSIVAAGNNEELGPKPPANFKDMHDFVDSKRNIVDVIMSGIFSYWFWLSICILFITGTQNINLYCFGYLIFCFYFFWYGLDFTIKERTSVMRIWNAVVYYNFIVILLKTWLQIVGCVYLGDYLSPVTKNGDSHCYLPEIFSIKCLNPQFPNTTEAQVCGVNDKEAGLTWDIVCFVVLLVQRRVFMSSYFLVVVAEERAQSRLASRGAALINMISSKKIARQEREKQRELANISKKLEKIRLRTIRLEGGMSREGWTHFDVIRSADETMFEDFSDDETTTVDSAADTLLDQSQSSSDKANPMRMLSVAIDSGLQDSLKHSGKSKRKEKISPERPTDIAEVDGEETPPSDTQSHHSAMDEPAEPAEGNSSPKANSLSKVTDQAKATDVWIKAFLIACTKWTINKLNEISYDYRTVASQIDQEQTTVKEEIKNKMMSAEGEEMRMEIEISQSDINIEHCEEMWQGDLEKKSLIYRLLNAIYLALVARTEFICYFTMILCQICNGNILSLPLPVVAALWGMLSLPRPAKTFWIMVLSYVMFVVVVKYIFQFSLWPWSKTALNKWNDPRLLIGIQQADPESCSAAYDLENCQKDKEAQSKSYYATYELLILLSVFVHRTVLKRYGLWKNEVEQEADLETVAQQSGASLERASSHILSDVSAEENCEEDGNDQQLIETTSTKKKRFAEIQKFCSIHCEISRSQKCFKTLCPEKTNMMDFAWARFYWLKRSKQLPILSFLYPVLSQISLGSIFFRSRGFSSVSRWYTNVRNGKFFSKGDYYSPMVFCDFINFIISVFAYNSFGPAEGGNVQDLIQSNRVPVSFLVILLVQFAFIVIDRALYLKKSVLGKLIFHVLVVILIHIYMFFLMPLFTNTSFNRNPAAQLWYFIKCIYFGLSAWQIKSGYPLGHLGNFLTTKYTYVNLVLFKAFILCPFLLELRSVMDWMWTKTSMSLGSWFLMEDIFVKLFTIKCFRQGEKDYPTVRGTNRSAIVKYGLGGFVLLALIFVIWFPLVIFSFANTIYLVNPPIQCQVTVSIGGFQDIFTVRSQLSGVTNVTKQELKDLREKHSNSPLAIGFLDNFDTTDIRTIRMNGASTAVWGITEPSESDLINVLNGNDSLAVGVTLSFTRRSKKGLTAGTISADYNFNLVPGSAIRKDLHDQLQAKGGKDKKKKPVVLADFLPSYLHLPATGQPSTVTALHCDPCDAQKQALGMVSLHGIALKLNKSNRTEYWSVQESSNCTQSFNTKCSPSSPELYSELFFVTFNDRVAPDAVSFITGPGIIGLYIGMVFVIGQFVRSLTSDGAYTVMFDELPNVDRIMKICKDLYFVRENGHLVLEEELFAKLIFLYRSPKMLIQCSKIKVS